MRRSFPQLPRCATRCARLRLSSLRRNAVSVRTRSLTSSTCVPSFERRPVARGVCDRDAQREPDDCAVFSPVYAFDALVIAGYFAAGKRARGIEVGVDIVHGMGDVPERAARRLFGARHPGIAERARLTRR